MLTNLLRGLTAFCIACGLSAGGCSESGNQVIEQTPETAEAAAAYEEQMNAPSPGV